MKAINYYEELGTIRVVISGFSVDNLSVRKKIRIDIRRVSTAKAYLLESHNFKDAELELTLRQKVRLY